MAAPITSQVHSMHAITKVPKGREKKKERKKERSQRTEEAAGQRSWG